MPPFCYANGRDTDALDSSSRLVFRKVDVTDWSSFCDLFEAALEKFGVIHAVISNAGMHQEDLLKDEFDSNGKLQKPNTASIDINLVSHLYASKLAFHYFAKGAAGPR